MCAPSFHATPSFSGQWALFLGSGSLPNLSVDLTLSRVNMTLSRGRSGIVARLYFWVVPVAAKASVDVILSGLFWGSDSLCQALL